MAITNPLNPYDDPHQAKKPAIASPSIGPMPVVRQVRAPLTPDGSFPARPRRVGPKRMRKRDRPRCGAKTRKGVPCVRKAVPSKARCPNHGGMSTGPKTTEGKAKSALNGRWGRGKRPAEGVTQR